MAETGFKAKVAGRSKAMVATGPSPRQNAHKGSHEGTHETVEEVDRLKGNGKTVIETGQCIHRHSF